MFRFGLIQSALAAIFVGLILTGPSVADANKPFFENNVNRWGADYSIFEVNSGGASVCYQACAKDKQCLAWTFHRPGTKGKTGECHLKSKVAHGRSNPCCISGVLIGQDTASGRVNQSAISSHPSTVQRLSGTRASVEESSSRKNFFRKASLSKGEAVGLPELTAVAATPPLKITPASFVSSEEL